MTPHRCPKSLTEMRVLPVTVKPHWESWWLRIVGPLLELWDYADSKLPLAEDSFLRRVLGLRFAHRFLRDFFTVAGGWNHAPIGTEEVPERLEIHEGVHDWQKRTRVLHDARYVLIREYRRHAEAQAYALEAALGYRFLDGAAASMSDPIYALGLTHDEARAWIMAYVSRWRRDCDLTWSQEDDD